MKTCRTCSTVLSDDAFYRSHGGRYLFSECIDCSRSRSKRWKTSHPGPKDWKKTPQEYSKTRERLLKRRYGIGSAEYDRMLSAQGCKCAICRTGWSSEHPLHVDHSHSSGAVRGLLCYKCNTAVGLINDSPEVAESLAAYLALPLMLRVA